MPRKTYRPEEIIAKLRQAEVLFGEGKKIPEVIKTLGGLEVTYYRWRKEYGGLEVLEAFGLAHVHAAVRRSRTGSRPHLG